MTMITKPNKTKWCKECGELIKNCSHDAGHTTDVLEAYTIWIKVKKEKENGQ